MKSFTFKFYVIHKILVFIKNQLNYLKDNFFERFFKKYNRHIFSKKITFLLYMLMENSRPEEDKIITGIRSPFGPKKKLKESNTQKY